MPGREAEIRRLTAELDALLDGLDAAVAGLRDILTSNGTARPATPPSTPASDGEEVPAP
jgi:hypothetical protein